MSRIGAVDGGVYDGARMVARLPLSTDRLHERYVTYVNYGAVDTRLDPTPSQLLDLLDGAVVLFVGVGVAQ